MYVSRGKERFITCLYWIPFLKKNGGYCFIRICRGECIGGFYNIFIIMIISYYDLLFVIYVLSFYCLVSFIHSYGK